MSEPTTEKPLPYDKYLKILGVCCFVLGLIEVSVGADAWNMVTNDKYGSWWAAMFVVIAGAVAVFAKERLHLQVLIGVSTFSLIMCFVGMIIDSLAYRRVNDMQTCVNHDTGEVYGDSGLEPWAQVCASKTWRLCSCIKEASDEECWNFDLSIYENDNCDLILTSYTDILLISACFTTFCLAFVTLLGVVSCVSYSKLDAPPASSEPTTAAAATAQAPAKEEPAAAPAVESPGAVELTLQEETPDANI